MYILHAAFPQDHLTEDRIMATEIKQQEYIKGGLADGKTEQDIADKHGVDLSMIEEQIKAGILIEKEHTDRTPEMDTTAKEIAKDHLMEHPAYYTFLQKMEKEMEKDYETKGYGKKKQEKVKPVSKQDSEDPEIEKQNTIKRLFG
jgi:hypothetical protein